MDFKLRYKINEIELEPSASKKYQQAIDKAKESDNPLECLSKINYALEALGNSFAATDREIEWSGEMIRAYRNLAIVYEGIVSSDEFKNYEGIVSSDEFKNYLNFSALLDKHNANGTSEQNLEMDDFQKYAEFLSVLSDYMQNYNAPVLKKILDVLETHQIENSSELEKVLEKCEEENIQARVNSSIGNL